MFIEPTVDPRYAHAPGCKCFDHYIPDCKKRKTINDVNSINSTDQLGKALKMFREHGVRDGYVSKNGDK